MPNSEKGNNSVKLSKNFMKISLGHLHHATKLHALDPSSSGSPDIFFTILFYCTKCQSRKSYIIQLNIHRRLSKVNQVMYTLDKICIPNIMIVAQGVLQIFCSQCHLWLECLRMKGGLNQPNIHRMLLEVNHHRSSTHIPNLYAWYHDPTQKLISSSTPWTKSVCQISWSYI